MSYSVINGAVGKSPMIDKVNQLTEGETRDKAAERMENLVCRKGSENYPALPVSFPECKNEMKRQIERRRKERADGTGDV